MKTIITIFLTAALAFGQNYTFNAASSFTLQASATKTANTSVTSTTNQWNNGARDLIITLDITAATHTTETYDIYITTSDGVSSWDIAHFPQIATTGAKRFTATISGHVYPQNVTTAAPGVQAVTTATMQTDTAGSANGIKTLGAGIVRHGPWGKTIGYELVCAGGGSPSITFSITVTQK